MINYWPIILESSVSAYSIWLEIRGSLIESGEEYLNLHLVYHTGTIMPAKEVNGFYECIEEGFEQTIFRLPVLKSALEKMVADIILKVTEGLNNSSSINFEFSHTHPDQTEFRVQILRREAESNFTFQVRYVKKEIATNFQIQTSPERILVFMAEFNEKIKKHN